MYQYSFPAFSVMIWPLLRKKIQIPPAIKIKNSLNEPVEAYYKQGTAG
jgi:hypothetical protein